MCSKRIRRREVTWCHVMSQVTIPKLFHGFRGSLHELIEGLPPAKGPQEFWGFPGPLDHGSGKLRPTIHGLPSWFLPLEHWNWLELIVASMLWWHRLGKKQSLFQTAATAEHLHFQREKLLVELRSTVAVVCSCAMATGQKLRLWQCCDAELQPLEISWFSVGFPHGCQLSSQSHLKSSKYEHLERLHL